jgi:hypothetical protein
MRRSSPRLVIVGCLFLVGTAWNGLLVERSRHRAIDAGFWFDQVAYESPRLGGVLTAHDLDTVRSVAMTEVRHAFAGLRLTLSERRDARFRVRVAQWVRDPRFNREVGVSGESRAVAGFGGQGTVSFYYHASNAEGYAAPADDRDAIIAAIGRGIGRAAVHEFAHQLLPKAPLHATTNVLSYEYRSAARVDQYYGRMEWDVAWPMLQRRYGS